MPIDNTLYDRLADTWWEEGGTLFRMRTVFNPPRFGYFCRVLTKTLGLDPRGLRALDVGCGGGLLAEEFAKLGYAVTGVDPSKPSIVAAREHAQKAGLAITYLVGAGEDLAFPEKSFDLVYCCDVLEHVEDPDRVIAESARVLKRGGVYAFDTINRTFRSWLFAVKLGQEWGWSSFLPAGLHDWGRFLKPREIGSMLARHGLGLRDMKGVQAAAKRLRLLRMLSRYKRGKCGLDELGAAAEFKIGRDMSIMYVGYAIKENDSPLATRH